MNILQINKLYYPWIGGVESHVQQISENLVKLGHSVTVLCASHTHEQETVQINQVKVNRFGSLGIYFGLPLSFRFFKAISQANADILHFHLPNPLAVLAYLLYRPKGKVVVTWHSDIHRQKLALFFYKPFLHYFLKLAETIIVTSPQMKKNSKHLQHVQKKISIIPLSLDLSKYPTKISPPISALFDNYLISIGRLVPYKGYETLIRAMEGTKQNLLIIGSGPLEAKLKLLIQRLNLSPYIKIIPAQDRNVLLQHLCACTYFVLPSIHPSEAFGIVQLEAMAYSKAIISTNLPTGVPYVNEHLVTGLVVEPKDILHLRDAIQALSKDNKLCKKMGLNGRKKLENLFTLPTMMDSLLQVYHT